MQPNGNGGGGWPSGGGNVVLQLWPNGEGSGCANAAVCGMWCRSWSSLGFVGYCSCRGWRVGVGEQDGLGAEAVAGWVPDCRSSNTGQRQRQSGATRAHAGWAGCSPQQCMWCTGVTKGLGMGGVCKYSLQLLLHSLHIKAHQLRCLSVCCAFCIFAEPQGHC